jgi:hypothetical protein
MTDQKGNPKDLKLQKELRTFYSDSLKGIDPKDSDFKQLWFQAQQVHLRKSQKRQSVKRWVSVVSVASFALIAVLILRPSGLAPVNEAPESTAPLSASSDLQVPLEIIESSQSLSYDDSFYGSDWSALSNTVEMTDDYQIDQPIYLRPDYRPNFGLGG